MTIQMKAIEQYFHMVLFIMLYRVVLTFKCVDETLVCDHPNESFMWYYAVQGGFSKVVDETLVCDHSSESY